MTIPSSHKFNGPSEHLNGAFGEWWYTLNGIGLLAFELFLECRGADANKHFYGALAFTIILWLLYFAAKVFPRVVRKIRGSKSPDDKKLERQIMRDYFGLIRTPFLYFPFFLGFISLAVLALWPAFLIKPNLYIQTLLN